MKYMKIVTWHNAIHKRDVFYVSYYLCTMKLSEDIEFMDFKLNVI